MRAFAFDQFDTPGSVQEPPQPEPQGGQVRVRVAASGFECVAWVSRSASAESQRRANS
jgi:NADPH:quinone reductase-like Zn-dependent oxidoreductase